MLLKAAQRNLIQKTYFKLSFSLNEHQKAGESSYCFSVGNGVFEMQNFPYAKLLTIIKFLITIYLVNCLFRSIISMIDILLISIQYDLFHE